MKSADCWHQKFHPTLPQCTKPAVFRSTGLGNMMDGSTWCIEHAPSKDYRVTLAASQETNQSPDNQASSPVASE